MTTTAVAHNLKEKPRTGDVLTNENVTFDGLLLSDAILKGLKSAGFERPSPIQLKAIPLGRCGLDLIVQAKSGTGKTCVFSVVALEGLQLDSSALQVLILAPTREIAIQIWDVIKSIGQPLPPLRCHTFIGGMPVQEDKQKLKRCHIAVGTPGRVKQLIEQGIMNIENIRMFVLDEADKLLEESFQEQINWIYSTLPDNKQMLALSATYPEYLAEHLTAYMRNPTFLRLNVSDPALLGIRQYYRTVKFHPLPNKLFERKVEVVTEILTSAEFQQCLIFSNLQTMAQNMADALSAKGWPTACIAGCLDQKDRNQAMEKLKAFKCRVLISTDLTSRGIDADKVNLVINLDVPKDHETYLHRTGRAGRFGTFGACLSIVSDGQELTNLRSIEKKCSTSISLLTDPIPVDLVKSAGTVNLDDMVSTEKIFTDHQHSGKSVICSLKIPHKAEKSQPCVNGGAKDSELSDDATIKISPSEKLASFTKVHIEKDKPDEKSTGKSKLDNNIILNGGINKLEVNEEAECKREEFVTNGVSAGNEECHNGNNPDEPKKNNSVRESTDSEKHTKIKSKPKPRGHKSANFWTQLIEERNDDEDYVREFQASQVADDIFGDAPAIQDYQELLCSKQDVKDLELKLESVRIEDSPGEILKRKTPKPTSKQEQLSAPFIELKDKVKINDLHLERSYESFVQEIRKMDIKIPSLMETVGHSSLKAPHTYHSALESFRKFKEAENSDIRKDINKSTAGNSKEIDTSLNEQTKKVNIADQSLFPVKVEKSLKYDEELLSTVKEFLSLMSLQIQTRNLSENSIVKSKKVTMEESKDARGTIQNQNEVRRQIKAVRSRNMQSENKEPSKKPFSVQGEEVVDIPLVESSSGKPDQRNQKETPELGEDVNSEHHSKTNFSALPSVLSINEAKNVGGKDLSQGRRQRPKSHKLGLSLGTFLQDLQSSNQKAYAPSNFSSLTKFESKPSSNLESLEESKTEDIRGTNLSQTKQKSDFRWKSSDINLMDNKRSVLDKSNMSVKNLTSDSEDFEDYYHNKESQHQSYRERRSKKTCQSHSQRPKDKGRQSYSDRHSHGFNMTSSSEEESDNDMKDNHSWESHMKHYQKAFSSHYYSQNPFMNKHQYPYMNMPQNPFMNMQHNPYMNMYHPNPYMAALNPYFYSNPWAYSYGQVPFQGPHLTYQQMSRNLERQQKYMRKMLRNFKRMTLED